MNPHTFTVGHLETGRARIDGLCSRLQLSRKKAIDLLRENQVRIGGVPCVDPQRRLRQGQKVEVRLPKAKPEKHPEPLKTTTSLQPKIVYSDAHVVVVDKPAGLTTMRHAEDTAEFGTRAKRFLPTTLADLLPTLIDPARPRPVFAVHRLDKETSGLIVFARTKEAEGHLGGQFRAHSTERLYIALVRGQAVSQRIESRLVDDRGDGRRGSGAGKGGQLAVTHVRLIEHLGDFSLVECRLETGRTHQVRIHLGEAGTPLCGERVYDRPRHGKPVVDGSGAKRIALHAATLGFDHPATGERLRLEAQLPKDMSDLLSRLRKRLPS